MGKPRTAKDGKGVPFSEHYKEACRIAWYEAGRPRSRHHIAEIVPDDEMGRKASGPILSIWRQEMDWDIWADSLDARANRIVEDELVNERVLMLKRQASVGKELQETGMEYLREHDFDTSASAVSAIVKGSELERTSRGISERLINLLKLSDDELTREAVQLLGRAKDSGEILDIPEEDIEEENGED